MLGVLTGALEGGADARGSPLEVGVGKWRLAWVGSWTSTQGCWAKLIPSGGSGGQLMWAGPANGALSG